MNVLLPALADGAIAVTPNRRLARRIHAEFDLALAASGQRAWLTPVILPYAGWLATLWESLLARDRRAISRTLRSSPPGPMPIGRERAGSASWIWRKRLMQSRREPR